MCLVFGKNFNKSLKNLIKDYINFFPLFVKSNFMKIVLCRLNYVNAVCFNSPVEIQSCYTIILNYSSRYHHEKMKKIDSFLIIGGDTDVYYLR